MYYPLVEIELIEDSLQVAAIAAARRRTGEMLICQRCMKADEVIAGVLVIDAMDQQWVLCGPCWRELPQGSHIV